MAKTPVRGLNGGVGPWTALKWHHWSEVSLLFWSPIEVKYDLAELGRFGRPFTHDPN